MAKILKFYDVKAKDGFLSSAYKTVTKMVKGNKRKFAIAKSPHTGINAWRILPKYKLI